MRSLLTNLPFDKKQWHFNLRRKTHHNEKNSSKVRHKKVESNKNRPDNILCEHLSARHASKRTTIVSLTLLLSSRAHYTRPFIKLNDYLKRKKRKEGSPLANSGNAKTIEKKTAHLSKSWAMSATTTKTVNMYHHQNESTIVEKRQTCTLYVFSQSTLLIEYFMQSTLPVRGGHHFHSDGDRGDVCEYVDCSRCGGWNDAVWLRQPWQMTWRRFDCCLRWRVIFIKINDSKITIFHFCCCCVNATNIFPRCKHRRISIYSAWM